jgi:hypothetical protein
MNARTTITTHYGTTFAVGDPVLALVRRRWRRGNIYEIAQGTGIERAFVTFEGGLQRWVSRYDLRPVKSINHASGNGQITTEK